jgi:hypothetical protein
MNAKKAFVKKIAYRVGRTVVGKSVPACMTVGNL